jgi:hypothetical protein
MQDLRTSRCRNSAATHPHHLGLLMLRGISSTGPFVKAKQCVINSIDTNYLLSADEVMDRQNHSHDHTRVLTDQDCSPYETSIHGWTMNY